jgi:hypothetical protein
MIRASVLLTLILAAIATPAEAVEKSLRCICVTGQNCQNISLNINYETSRVIEIMDWEPGRPRTGYDKSGRDGSLPAQITDALVVWTVPFSTDFEHYQLDRYTGVLSENWHLAGNSGSSSSQCRIVMPGEQPY